MADKRITQLPGVVSVGDARVTAIAEQPLTGLNHLIALATPDAVREIEWLVPDYADVAGELLGVIQAFVIEIDDVTIVVDTCIGNGKDLPAAPHWSHLSSDFPARLIDAGVDVNAVDIVLCTHLHLDHVGWNTTQVEGQWVPTFPNARHVLVQRELDHWRNEAEGVPSEISPSDDRERARIAFQWTQANVLAQSVEPLFEADLVELVDAPHVVAPGVRLISTPGHTPGHVSVEIQSAGQRAIITGDCFHHPCQIARPQWSTRVDADRAQSSATRVELLDDISGSDCVLIGTHFTSPFAGRVVWTHDAHRLVPVGGHE